MILVRRLALVLVSVALCASLWGFAPLPALAAPLVTNCNDSGEGSLRNAITTAAGGDTITFLANLNCTSTGLGPIVLSSTLTIDKSLTIDGSGATIAVDGNNAVTVFVVNGGVTATLTALTIQHGNAANGGGIVNNGTLTVMNGTISGNIAQAFSPFGGGINNDGMLTVTNSTISGNSAGSPVSGPAFGGGINNSGTLIVTNSTISGNSATAAGLVGSGVGGGINNTGMLTVTNSTISGNGGGGKVGDAGGINNTGTAILSNSTISGNGSNNVGGGIQNSGTLTVTNSTISGNQANVGGLFQSAYGGGIYDLSGGTVTLTNSTIAGNSAVNGGGGIDNAGGTVTVTNTIVAGNSATGNGQDVLATVTSGGHNLVGKTDGSSGWIASDQTGTAASPLSAKLGPLANYGGLTQTLPLLPGSPAIDAGDDMTCSAAPVSGKDQRGVARPQGAHCDSGAFESQGFTLAKTSGDNQTTLVNTPFASPLVVTVTSAHNEPVGGGSVAFTGPASGAGIGNSPLTAAIGGNGQASVAATANGTPGGPYAVVASAAGATPAVAFSLANIALVSIGVTPNPVTLKVGQGQQFVATGTYTDNSTADLTAQVTWSSDAPSVVGVDTSGRGTAKVAGTAHVTATQGMVSGQASVTVSPPVLTGVQPAPAPQSRPTGADAPTQGTKPAAVPTGR